MCPRTTYEHRPDQLRPAVGITRNIHAEHTILKLKLQLNIKLHYQTIWVDCPLFTFSTIKKISVRFGWIVHCLDFLP